MTAQYYRVTVGSLGLTMEQLHDPCGQQEIRIIPVIGGAGGDVGQILIGVALIVTSFFVPFAASALFLAGTSMVLTGVAGLLSPTPQPSLGSDGANDPRKSYSFSGIQNTSRQGVPVPVVYGETLVGSVVISAGIDTVQVKA